MDKPCCECECNSTYLSQITKNEEVKPVQPINPVITPNYFNKEIFEELSFEKFNIEHRKRITKVKSEINRAIINGFRQAVLAPGIYRTNMVVKYQLPDDINRIIKEGSYNTICVESVKDFCRGAGWRLMQHSPPRFRFGRNAYGLITVSVIHKYEEPKIERYIRIIPPNYNNYNNYDSDDYDDSDDSD